MILFLYEYQASNEKIIERINLIKEIQPKIQEQINIIQEQINIIKPQKYNFEEMMKILTISGILKKKNQYLEIERKNLEKEILDYENRLSELSNLQDDDYNAKIQSL